jgi:hypothetical protein
MEKLARAMVVGALVLTGQAEASPESRAPLAGAPAGVVRLERARLVMPVSHERYQEADGALVLDVAGMRLTFETPSEPLFEVSFEAVAALRYERTDVPRRAFGRASHIVAIESPGSTPDVRIVRWCSEHDARAALQVLSRLLGRPVVEVERRRSFANLALYVSPGDTVYVTDASGRREKGRVLSLSASELLLTSDHAGTVRRGEAGLRTIELGELAGGRNAGFLVLGAIAGYMGGGLVAFMTSIATQSDGVMLIPPALGLAGGIVGHRIDAHRTRVVYAAPHR